MMNNCLIRNALLSSVIVLVMLLISNSKPETASAHIGWHAIYWQPAAGATISTNSCGWHDACIPPYNAGNGLDFHNDSDYTVRLNAYGYADSWYEYPVTFIQFSATPFGNCTSIKAHVRTYWTDQHLHDQWFVHTNQLRLSQFYVYGGHEVFQSNQVAVGTMVFGDSCPWGGVHVHTDNTGPWTEFHNPNHSESSTAYPWAPGAKGLVGNWNLDNWAYRVWWYPYFL